MLNPLFEDAKNMANLLEQALVQYDKVNTKGVSYTLNTIQVTGETHFDMEDTIIKELQTLVDLATAPTINDWEPISDSEPINEQWKIGVGGEQKKFTAEMVHEYCCDVPFYPVPDFSSRPQSKKQFYNYCDEDNLESWFSDNSKLGVDFAIYKGESVGWEHGRRYGRAWGWSAMAIDNVAGDDLAAVKALCKVRTEDFISLRGQLETLVTVHKQSQVFRK
jgi:hypothetical protein